MQKMDVCQFSNYTHVHNQLYTKQILVKQRSMYKCAVAECIVAE